MECIWVLPDGKKWGIQAKFFSHLDGKKGQLQDSFEQAMANHPELEQYTFCFPIQLTGPTGARRSQVGNTRRRQTEKFEGWIEEFTASTSVPCA